MTSGTRALAVVVAVLLVAGLAAAVVRDDDGPTAAVTTTSSTASTVPGQTTTTGAPSTELDRAIAEIEAFVAKARRLPFKSQVKVTLLDDAAFRARLKADSDLDKEELAKTTKVLRALDLIGPGVDLEKALDSLLGDAVLGFYDHEKDELVVRGATLTPGVRQTLAHELTHALQDQHFELNRPELDDRDDEASLAFSALVEGDARRIEGEYTRTLSKAEQRQAERQTSGVDLDPTIPEVLLDSLLFPYVSGPPFAARVAAAERLDEAFRTPPTTTEQVLHPARYLAGEQPRTVAEPAADGPVFDRGVVGEFGLALIFGHDVPAEEARSAVAGWGGDRYVAWETGGRVCVRATFEMDTPRDADELTAALGSWARRHRGASVHGTTLTSCR